MKLGATDQAAVFGESGVRTLAADRSVFLWLMVVGDNVPHNNVSVKTVKKKTAGPQTRYIDSKWRRRS